MREYEDFISDFKLLTNHDPFPWQAKLFSEFVEKRFRKVCPVPTGLGKTSIIAIWLLALVHHAENGSRDGFPRRLAYVVNRRTVVDQATREVEKMRDALVGKPELQIMAEVLRALSVRPLDIPVAISTLRGQFADNAEWRDDPARPAVIIGTVDMIGSRLLFSGYGRGFKSRPLHAGFLGQDTLLVHDEAHLEPAFQELVSAIESEQLRCREFRNLRVMELTATSRSADVDDDPLFTDADRGHDEVKKRVEAKKGIKCHLIAEEKNIADEIAKLAKKHKDSGQAILIFARKVEDVEKVVTALRKEKLQVETLTGTLRGRERDALANINAIFARFMPGPEVTPQDGTVYLVCTSAGEVGVNISADHLICDLTPLDSMIQRFGRVNRFGNSDAWIDIVHSFVDDESEADSADMAGTESAMNVVGQGDTIQDIRQQTPFARACEQTLKLMRRLPRREDGRYDASPAALANLPQSERQAAFTPLPVIQPTSDILFDAWAMTSIRQKLPSRPPIADWLHGIAAWVPPETHIAWREEVGLLTQDIAAKYAPADLMEDYPLKPHELLRDQTARVFAHLEKIAVRCPDLSAWLIDSEEQISIVPLNKLVERDKQRKPVIGLDNCTVILPPAAGGLRGGLLGGDAVFDETGGTQYDVADLWLDTDGKARRCRLWDELQPPEEMRLIRTIDTWLAAGMEDERNGDETLSRRFWHWFVRPRTADDDGSGTARVQQELSPHLQTAEDYARRLVVQLDLKGPEAEAVIFAARWHDLGKRRLIWQRSIGNRAYPSLTLAKSGPGMRPIDITQYRHEFGSLVEVKSLPEFCESDTDVQELLLHLIAAHHGRARPHFPAEEAFDPNTDDATAGNLAREVPGRFARLQRKYGRWGLAYLESLVRAADALASQSGADAAQSGSGSASFDGGVR